MMPFTCKPRLKNSNLATDLNNSKSIGGIRRVLQFYKCLGQLAEFFVLETDVGHFLACPFVCFTLYSFIGPKPMEILNSEVPYYQHLHFFKYKMALLVELNENY